jgi:hypothetical protein
MPRKRAHDWSLQLPLLGLLGSLVLVAAACTGGGHSQAKKVTAQMVEVKDHIVSMDVSSSVDAKGQPVDPSFTFGPSAKQITVLAHVGILTGDPPLVFTWSQTTSSGDKALFSQTVQVKSLDVAFSVGKSPGTLTVGTYKITATLGGETKSTQVVVSAPQPSNSTSGASSAASSSGNQASASAGPPVSGQSGAASQSAPASPPDSPGMFSDLFLDHYDTQDHLGWYYQVYTTNPAKYTGDFTLQVNGGSPVSMGRVQGSTVLIPELASSSHRYHAAVQSEWEIVPCDVPGGSDLPGTRLVVKSTTHSSYGQQSLQESVVLGPDTMAPDLTVTADPPYGSRVKAGDQITFHVTAEELRGPGYPWQTGVSKIGVLDAQGDAVTPQTYGDAALPCEQKSWKQKATFTYTVPANPPNPLYLYPYAQDFGQSPARAQSFDYFTADTWTGTMNLAGFTDHTLGVAEILCKTPPVDFTISFTSAPDGTLQGTGRVHGPPYTCNGASSPPESGTFAIVGRRTGNQLSLGITLPHSGDFGFVGFWPNNPRLQWNVPIQGTHAHTVITGEALGTSPGHVTLKVDLTCSGCTTGPSGP